MGISAPPAGIAPNGKPMTVPRSHGFQERFQSSLRIHGTPTGMVAGVPCRRCAAIQSASPTANRATAMTTTSMPPESSGWPNVSRGCPVVASRPTSPMVNPMNSEASPRMRLEPSTVLTATKAKTIIAKYEGAPSPIAIATTNGATKTSAPVASVPATNEPMAAVASAWAPRPALAILLPSSAVTTEEDSPGVLSRMEVVDPPYMPP